MKREPLVIRGAVVAFIVAVVQVVMAFGAPIDTAQFAALSTLINLGGTVAVVVWSRGKVTPVEEIEGWE